MTSQHRGVIYEMITSQTNISNSIIEEAPQQFEKPRECELFKKASKELSKYPQLNQDQINAISQSIIAKSYNLILGMPGTGKTYTIAVMIKILTDIGQKVLLSSYTHLALDNILKKFIKLFPRKRKIIVRVARNQYVVNESLRNLVYKKSYMKSTGQIDKFLADKMIYAVTCLSANNSIICFFFLFFT